MQRNINLKHLRYFWMIAREGSITRAAEAMELTPQTLSGQLAAFEESLGSLLFERVGRKLYLTDFGRSLWPYAQEIFVIAAELETMVAARAGDRPQHLRVGICSSIHKLLAYQLIEPALKLSQELTLECYSGTLGHLMDDLKKKQIDIVLTDQIPGKDPDFAVRQHLLEQTTISLFAAPELAVSLRTGFPKSLDGYPFLANSSDSQLIRDIRQWFHERGLHFRIQATVDDSALIKVFARDRMGVFAAPTAITSEVCRQYNVEPIGKLDDIKENLYAISQVIRRENAAIKAIYHQSEHVLGKTLK